MPSNDRDSPPVPTPESEMAVNRNEAAIEQFRAAIIDADVEYVGKDHEYVPDGPHARAGHPNVEAGAR